MAAFAQTIAEARDRILKRINAVGSSTYETHVLELMNEALVFISSLQDWEYLYAYTTLTPTTSPITLPADVDRIMSIHESGQDEFLVKLAPQDFEMVKEDSSITKPTYWCHRGCTQSVGGTSAAPSIQIEIYTAPTGSNTFNVRYLKTLDELVSTDVVPNLPLPIWELVIRKATLEILKTIEAPARIILNEAQSFERDLDAYRKREDKGSTHYGSIRQNSQYLNHYATRMG